MKVGYSEWWPRKGSRPSPQSPKGILGFLSSDEITYGTPKTKANLLNLRTFEITVPGKKSPRPVKSPGGRKSPAFGGGKCLH